MRGEETDVRSLQCDANDTPHGTTHTITDVHVSRRRKRLDDDGCTEPRDDRPKKQLNWKKQKTGTTNTLLIVPAENVLDDEDWIEDVIESDLVVGTNKETLNEKKKEKRKEDKKERHKDKQKEKQKEEQKEKNNENNNENQNENRDENQEETQDENERENQTDTLGIPNIHKVVTQVYCDHDKHLYTRESSDDIYDCIRHAISSNIDVMLA